MSSVSHLNALSERHQKLEHQLAQELKKPGYDDQKVRELKRRKLEIKDQIARLSMETRH